MEREEKLPGVKNVQWAGNFVVTNRRAEEELRRTYQLDQLFLECENQPGRVYEWRWDRMPTGELLPVRTDEVTRDRFIELVKISKQLVEDAEKLGAHPHEGCLVLSLCRQLWDMPTHEPKEGSEQ